MQLCGLSFPKGICFTLCAPFIRSFLANEWDSHKPYGFQTSDL
jgi:hypothetical protein